MFIHLSNKMVLLYGFWNLSIPSLFPILFSVCCLYSKIQYKPKKRKGDFSTIFVASINPETFIVLIQGAALLVDSPWIEGNPDWQNWEHPYFGRDVQKKTLVISQIHFSIVEFKVIYLWLTNITQRWPIKASLSRVTMPFFAYFFF